MSGKQTWGDIVAEATQDCRDLDEHVHSVPDVEKPGRTQGMAHVTIRSDSIAFRAGAILVNGRALICEDWKLGRGESGVLLATVRFPATLDIRSHAEGPSSAPNGEQLMHHLSVVHAGDAFIGCATLLDGRRFPVGTLDVEMRAGQPPIVTIAFDCTVSLEAWAVKS